MQIECKNLKFGSSKPSSNITNKFNVFANIIKYDLKEL